MPLSADTMPGATPEIRAAQFRQFELCSKLYETWNRARQTLSDKDALTAPEVVAAKAAYEASVTELEQMVGKDAPYYQVDYNLANLFSDAYKYVTGFRPRGLQFTRQQTLDWLSRNSMTPAEL